MDATLDYSVVIPVYNEEESLPPLVEGVVRVMAGVGKPYEVVLVDDGSSDRSWAVMGELKTKNPALHLVKFRKNCGQSAAFAAGFAAARAAVVITMDADLQNEPEDIPKLLALMGEWDVVCGWREKRQDSKLRLISSRIANGVRNWLSQETIRDTGCSLKAFRAECVKRMKLYNGMHRFFPTLAKFDGYRVTEVPVRHHARQYGKSKYGVWNRVFRSFVDLMAVRWMKKRWLRYEVEQETV